MSFTHTQFVSATDALFTIEGGALRQIHLAQVGNPRPCGQAYISFSLLFDTDATDPLLHQGTYRLRNATLGVSDMFIAPIHYSGGTPDKQYYEAVFTHHAGDQCIRV